MRRVEELLEGVIVTAIALGRRQIEEGDDAKREGVDDAAASLRDAIKVAIEEAANAAAIVGTPIGWVDPSRRERIATAALEGSLACSAMWAPARRDAAKEAVTIADALIAELDK
jgi:precorrin isomerase